MTDEYDYPPGSPGAQEHGCSCPVLDNPYMGIEEEYVINFDCPLHGVDEYGD